MIEIDIFNHSHKEVRYRKYEVPVKLLIKKESYENAKKDLKVKDTRSTIWFDHVIFSDEVSINVDENIDDNILIGFSNCSIELFSDFALVSKKSSLYFGNSIVYNLTIRSNNLASIRINNSFGNFFIAKTGNVHISYTEENINPFDWRKNIKNQEGLNQILKFKTLFHLTDVNRINVYGNQTSRKQKEELKNRGLLKLLGGSKEFKIIRATQFQSNQFTRFLSEDEKRLLNINIQMDFSADFDHQETKISGMLMNSLSVTGKPKGLTTIENTNINNIFIRNFLPLGNFELFNVSPFNPDNPLFEIHRSNLDTTFFNYINLSKYEMVFFRSKITNLTLTAVDIHRGSDLKKLKISSRENIHEKVKILSEVDYKTLYELFLQLKLIFEKQGNTYEALRMKSVAHYFLGKMHSNWVNKLADYIKSKIPSKKYTTIAKLANVSSILTLNRLSNNNGISIFRAFFWLLIFILIFHTLNIYSFNSIVFTYRSWNEVQEIILENLRFFFIIANPAHKTSSLVPNSGELTTATYAISFFSRIVISYIYYQFIVAFRRFGK